MYFRAKVIRVAYTLNFASAENDNFWKHSLWGII